jgi:hypothetical protein
MSKFKKKTAAASLPSRSQGESPLSSMDKFLLSMACKLLHGRDQLYIYIHTHTHTQQIEVIYVPQMYTTYLLPEKYSICIVPLIFHRRKTLGNKMTHFHFP